MNSRSVCNRRIFPGDSSVRRYAEAAHDVVRWTEFGEGGHYAALQVPGLLAADVREFFMSLAPLSDKVS